MPQFEIKHSEDDGPVAKVRGRTLDDAVRRHFGLDDRAVLSVEASPEFGALEGWLRIIVGGEVVGEIREFQRMKFRRA